MLPGRTAWCRRARACQVTGRRARGRREMQSGRDRVVRHFGACAPLVCGAAYQRAGTMSRTETAADESAQGQPLEVLFLRASLLLAITVLPGSFLSPPSCAGRGVWPQGVANFFQMSPAVAVPKPHHTHIHKGEEQARQQASPPLARALHEHGGAASGSGGCCAHPAARPQCRDDALGAAVRRLSGVHACRRRAAPPYATRDECATAATRWQLATAAAAAAAAQLHLHGRAATQWHDMA